MVEKVTAPRPVTRLPSPTSSNNRSMVDAPFVLSAHHAGRCRLHARLLLDAGGKVEKSAHRIERRCSGHRREAACGQKCKLRQPPCR
jgi:hypothetical protein